MNRKERQILPDDEPSRCDVCRSDTSNQIYRQIGERTIPLDKQHGDNARVLCFDHAQWTRSAGGAMRNRVWSRKVGHVFVPNLLGGDSLLATHSSLNDKEAQRSDLFGENRSTSRYWGIKPLQFCGRRRRHNRGELVVEGQSRGKDRNRTRR